MEQQKEPGQFGTEMNTFVEEYLMTANRMDHQKESNSKTAEELGNTILELRDVLLQKSNLELTYIKENHEQKLRIANFVTFEEQLREKISDAKDILSSFVTKYNCIKKIPQLGIKLGEKFDKDYENIEHIVYLYKEKRRNVLQKLSDEAEKQRRTYMKLKEESSNEARLYHKNLEDRENELEEKRNNIKDLKNQLWQMEQKKENELEKLRKILDENDELNIRLNNLRESREHEAIKHTEKKQSYIDIISNLKEEIETAKESAEQSKLEVELKENAYKNQENFIKELESENTKMESYIVDMEQKIQDKRLKIDDMKEDNKRKYNELQSKLLELEKENAKIQEENVNLCQTSEVIQQKVSSNEERIKMLEEKIISGENSIKVKESQLLEREKLQNQIISTHAARMKESNVEIQCTREKNKCYLEEGIELRNELSVLNEKVALKEDEYTNLQNEISTQERGTAAHMARLEANNKLLEQRIANAKREFAEVTKQKQEELDQEMEKSKMILDQAQKKFDEEKYNIDKKIKSVLDEYTKNIAQLEQDISALDAEEAKLKNKSDVYNTKLDSLMQTAGAVEAEIKASINDQKPPVSSDVQCEKELLSLTASSDNSSHVECVSQVDDKKLPAMCETSQTECNRKPVDKESDLFDRIRLQPPNCETPVAPGKRRLYNIPKFKR